MILGLVWQLILHYQIGEKQANISLKNLLYEWMRLAMPERNIRNLKSDWSDGIALCNLLEMLKPGSCPGYAEMQPENALANATKGLLYITIWKHFTILIFSREKEQMHSSLIMYQIFLEKA